MSGDISTKKKKEKKEKAVTLTYSLINCTPLQLENLYMHSRNACKQTSK